MLFSGFENTFQKNNGGSFCDVFRNMHNPEIRLNNALETGL